MKMMKTGPYIGVTGFMEWEEIAPCESAFRHAVHRVDTSTAHEMKLMVGILVGSKTLVGGTNKWFRRYPPVDQIAELISREREHLLYTIHYNTDDSVTIDEQIDQLMSLSPNIDAIQLNIKWTNHVKLQRIKRKHPHLRVILQVGAGALSEVEEVDDIHLGEALRAYDGVVRDFLVDPSGGTGKSLDVWKAFACIADDEIPKSMRPGIAGGRHAGNVHEARGLQRRLKCPVNQDAEGRLRDEADGGGNLVVPIAEDFIARGVEVIASVDYL